MVLTALAIGLMFFVSSFGKSCVDWLTVTQPGINRYYRLPGIIYFAGLFVGGLMLYQTTTVCFLRVLLMILKAYGVGAARTPGLEILFGPVGNNALYHTWYLV